MGFCEYATDQRTWETLLKHPELYAPRDDDDDETLLDSVEKLQQIARDLHLPQVG